MSNVQFIKYQDTQILVRFDGISRNIEGEPEKINEVMGACVLVKKDPSEDNREYLRGLLNPITKHDFSERLDIDKNGNLYLKGTKEAMPEGLTTIVKDYIENDVPIDSLVNFWELCLSNPNSVARDGFYKYIKDFGIVITDAGYAILYKAVNKVGKDGGVDRSTSIDPTLSQYVSNQYLRIKGMKKSPKNYNVYVIESYDNDENAPIDRYELSTHTGTEPKIDGELETIVDELGTLHDLYKQVIEEGKEMVESDDKVTVYRPGHSGDYGMEIRLGEPVTMPREKCDPNINNDCSYGLHVGSHRYVASFGRGMGAILAVLVNPADVVALPHYDHSKIRVCRYFPYAEIERDDNGDWEELEHGYFEEDFMAHEYNEVKQALEELYERKSDGEEIDTEEEATLNRRLILLSSHA